MADTMNNTKPVTHIRDVIKTCMDELESIKEERAGSQEKPHRDNGGPGAAEGAMRFVGLWAQHRVGNC